MNKKNKRGRPSKYSEQLVEDILTMIRRGVPIETAAAANGVTGSLLRQWKLSKPNFLSRLKEAQAGSKAYFVGIIQKAATTDWKAAAWLLERRYPEEFARVEALALAQRIREDIALEKQATPEIVAEIRAKQREYYRRTFNLAPLAGKVANSDNEDQSPANGTVEGNGHAGVLGPNAGNAGEPEGTAASVSSPIQ